MFAALDEALARLYPTRRWGELDEAAGFGAGLDAGDGDALAAALAGRLKAATLFRPGAPDETCDYVYVLCVGRTPSLIELREGALAPKAAAALRGAIADSPVEEVYLRVALSTIARFAAVQEIAVAGESDGAAVVITERPRAGVFAPGGVDRAGDPAPRLRGDHRVPRRVRPRRLPGALGRSPRHRQLPLLPAGPGDRVDDDAHLSLA
jgi:hypothetical protein